MAVDIQGNAYAIQEDRVRRISPLGVVTTLAGGDNAVGAASYVDAVGASARFKSLSGIAVDASSNVYLADTGNSAIRKVMPNGVVTTLAGGPDKKGYEDGLLGTAKFANPWAVALDVVGNLYVLDLIGGLPSFSGLNPSQGFVIRKISTAGDVSTVARGTSNSLIFPGKLAVDRQGNIFVTIMPASPGFVIGQIIYTIREAYIQKITPSGAVSIFAGSDLPGSAGMVDGPGNIARFATLKDIAIDAQDRLYVSDTFVGLQNSAVRRITPDGLVTTVVGNVNQVVNRPPGITVLVKATLTEFTYCSGVVAVGKHPAIHFGAGYCGGDAANRVVFIAEPS